MTCYLNFEEMLLNVSVHAHQRCHQRGVKAETIAHLLRFGKKYYKNNAVYYRVGRKEIAKHAAICPALKDMNGLHLVMGLNGKIITLFRNRNFRHQRI